MANTAAQNAANGDGPVAPFGINHIVIHVRDLAESHRFYTEILGLRQVGEFRSAAAGVPRRGTMRFYSGDRDGRLHHHDIALIENPAVPPPSAGGPPSGIVHIAFAMADREAWLRQLAFLQRRGVAFERRVEHGVTHSVYIRDPNGYGVELLYELPRAVWEGDLDAALNHYVNLPTEGPGALEDRTEIPVFARHQAAAGG
jgi:catechol 2,3-dioxygenase